jgi:hypothetical protein
MPELVAVENRHLLEKKERKKTSETAALDDYN